MAVTLGSTGSSGGGGCSSITVSMGSSRLAVRSGLRRRVWAIGLAARVGGGFFGDRVDLLQAPDADGIAAAGGDGFDGGAGSAHGGDARDAIGNGVLADQLFIRKGVRAAGGCVDDQVEGAGFDEVHGV